MFWRHDEASRCRGRAEEKRGETSMISILELRLICAFASKEHSQTMVEFVPLEVIPAAQRLGVQCVQREDPR